MRRIDNDIKSGQYKNIYLLYGPEDYLKIQYRNKLLDALVNDGDNMNFSKYEGKGINVLQIIDQSETLPFFAERRVILIEDSGYGKSIPADIGDYLATIPDTTIFIFVENDVDKRGKLYKAAKSVDRDIEMKKPDERILQAWIGARLKEEGIQMKRDAWSLFLSMTHESMDNMDRELDKLISYVGNRDQITIDDVRSICVAQVETRVFDMINSIAARDLHKTMDLYEDLLAEKEPPMKILSLIVSQFRQMKIVKECSRHGEDFGTISRKAGAPDFVVRRLIKLSNNFSDDEISELLQNIAGLEYKTKTGQLDENLAVELIIMQYARG